MINSVSRGPVERHVLPDPDEVTELLAEGYTLPSEFYTDERIFELEDYWIWQRSWQPAGIVAEVAEAGDFLTTKVGTVPVVVVRGRDGELRAFVNICRHRMHTVARGCGNRKTLQCIYHGWTYDLDGTLRAIPRADEGEIEPSEFGLVPAAVDTFKGVVWVSVEPREPLLDFLGEAPAIAERMGYGWPFELHDDWVRVENTRKTYIFPANWKITVENAVECYHCPTMHTHSFSDFFNVDPDGYSFNDYDRGIFHLANFTEQTAAKLGETRPHDPSFETADFRFLFPYPNGVGMGVWGDDGPVVRIGTGTTPLGVDKSLFFNSIVYERRGAEKREPTAFQLEQAAMLDKTFEEDLEACGLIQEGLRSGRIRYGKTVPRSESNIRHFQQLWWEALEPAIRAAST
jgi:phenylpropionate dioxygenase-like ring-hydroxylating dioxygenase large terminal subunit